METPAVTLPDAPSGPPPAPPFEPTREVRFAVVMYGGVSLCIYINGIAQELLHLVRATAPGSRALSPVEAVYRELGEALGARFTVDILSGTSAGGINAVFLAKALANDQSMQQLKQLWISEGDIAKLINDRDSTRGTALPPPRRPESLLNGQRMYQKLVQAFDGMDDDPRKAADAAPAEPLAPEIDLFVTATDIAGVTLPLRLSDRIVHERRHRGLFHFRFRRETQGDTHFDRAHNPFLAFAARCTSAFPFAFEPMRLKDVDAVLETVDGRRGSRDGRAEDRRWKRFMEPFVTPEGTARLDPLERSFGDGGYLDNKPFSYAVDALLAREAALPVERKLVYVEPKPEHPERDPAPAGRPDAIENVLAATVGLPRYETIREDLERVLARNRLTERVRLFTREIDRDVASHTAGGRHDIYPAGTWREWYLEDMLEAHGLPYGAYHRLRVAATTDWLARVLARARDIPEGSDHRLAIRQLVGAWRAGNYALRREEGLPPENAFLLDYDLAFRIRRIRYLLGKANWLHRLDRDARATLEQIAAAWRAHGEEALAALLPEGGLTGETEADFQDELLRLKNKLLPAYTELRRAEEELTLPGERNPLHAAVDALGLTGRDLSKILGARGREARERAARSTLAEPGAAEVMGALRDRLEGTAAGADPRGAEPDVRVRELIDQLREAPDRTATLGGLADVLLARLDEARGPSSEAVRSLQDRAPTAGRQLAREVLWHYYRRYPDYDMVSFPILYSTEAGEQETVDVIRISPEDATWILDESRDPRGRRKLAGTALGNFGGFLQDTWRVNDMLWGRLDGAERIICSLLPGDDADTRARRDGLLERISLAILDEEFRSVNRGQVSGLMSQSLTMVAAGRPPGSAVAQLTGRIGSDVVPKRLDALFTECLDTRALLAYLCEGYEVDRDLEPQAALASLARGSQVVGRMLEGITERHGEARRGARWVTRAGSWFWGLVQVATPRTLASMIFDHWLGLFYLFAVLLLALGLFARGAVLQWGIGILGAAGGVHAVVLVLRDGMRRRGQVQAVAKAMAAFAAIALVAAGALWVTRQQVSIEAVERLRSAIPLAALRDAPAIAILCGVLGAAILAGTAFPLLSRRWSGLLPGGFLLPGLAAEFPADAADLAKLTQGELLPPEAREEPTTDAERRARDARDAERRKHRKLPAKIVRDLYADYAFIAAYWLLFLLLADRLAGASVWWLPAWTDRWLVGAAVLAAVTATATALLDVIENVRIHEAFTAFRGREEGWMARGIRLAATWKWMLAFVTVLLLSPLFAAAAEPEWRLLSAGWVAVGLGGIAASVRWPRALQWVFPLLGLGLLAAAAWFLWPGRIPL